MRDEREREKEEGLRGDERHGEKREREGGCEKNQKMMRVREKRREKKGKGRGAV